MKKSFLHHGRPVLTTMLQAETPLRMRELIRKGLAGGTDAFGMQIEHLGAAFRDRKTFTWLFEEMGDKPCYVTDYRFAGGQENRSDASLVEELLMLLDCGATLIDVMGDLYAPAEHQFTSDPDAVARQEALIREIHARGGEVLMSSHTGCFLPTDRVTQIMAEQHRRGADVAKVVTMAEDPAQLAENLQMIPHLKQNLKGEFLFLCGGEQCNLHRRLGPLMGNTMFLCVAEHDAFSTVYQPTLARAKALVELACEGIAY